MTWQPIETAPEGVHILLWFPEGEKGIGGMEAATYFHDYPLSGWSHGGSNSGYDFDFCERPTHWHPLPDAPPT